MASTSRSERTADSSSARPLPPAQFPFRFGSWELVSRLGGGELSEVFLARAAGSRLDQPADYAIKLLRPKWHADARGRATLAREVQVARRIVHPHLVPILAAELEIPPYYLSMPYLEGSPLSEYLEQGSLLDLPAMFWIVRQTAEGLAALAAGGWMHGDVKPSNLIVAPGGHTTLIDLGFATPTKSPTPIAERPLVGTLCYMAPELLYSSLGGDSQADVYSLGVVLFEMLTGRLPFDARDVAELALQHRQQLPSDVRSFMPQVPIRAARLVQQMLSKEPLRRPTPGEVVERLIALEIETFAERHACEAAA